MEERIRELAGCECGEAVRPEDSKCKIKGFQERSANCGSTIQTCEGGSF